jgi:CheY-like chemotaxis protein
MDQSIEPVSSGKIVAVVDDDPAVRNSLKFSLEAEGLAVRAFAAGQDLMESVGDETINCFVIEFRLEDIDGVALTDCMRSKGLRTPIIVRGTELADVLDSELVGASIDHTGSMTTRPSAKSNNSGFMPADSIPDDRHTSGIADHLSYYDNHGGDGSYSRLQMDLHKIPSCNVNTPWPIPNSGYRIKREVKAEGTKVVGIVTKTAEDVTIDGNSTTAGLTPRKQAKVTLRT